MTRPATCSCCKYFRDDPEELERIFPAVVILSSVHGSARGSSGICEVRSTFQLPSEACDAFVGRFEAHRGGVTER